MIDITSCSCRRLWGLPWALFCIGPSRSLSWYPSWTWLPSYSSCYCDMLEQSGEVDEQCRYSFGQHDKKMIDQQLFWNLQDLHFHVRLAILSDKPQWAIDTIWRCISIHWIRKQNGVHVVPPKYPSLYQSRTTSIHIPTWCWIDWYGVRPRKASVACLETRPVGCQHPFSPPPSFTSIDMCN